MKNRSHLLGLGSLLAAAAMGAAQVQAAAPDFETLCGADNVEDMVPIPGTHWIIGSGMGDRYFQGGGLHLIDTQRATVRKLAPEITPAMRAAEPYDQCPGPVAADRFSAHGLSLVATPNGSLRLYAVNHGGRESIEVFTIASGPQEPVLTWIGCVLTPATAMSNSIVARPDGSLVLSASNAGSTPFPSFHELSMRPPAEQGHEWDDQGDEAQMGALFAWTREQGWREIPGSALPGNNGIELSRDGKWAFVNSWPGESVTRLPLDPTLGQPTTVKLGFKADNIRWSTDGTLIATGQLADVKNVIACALGDGSGCAIGYRAVAIDPDTMAVTQLYSGTGTERFGAATVGVKAGESLWLGSLRSHCIAKVRLSQHR